MNCRINKNAILALLVVTACLGCSEDWRAETHPVTGLLTINGKPPEGAVVTLYPAGEKIDKRNSRPWGMVQEDGTFTLTTYEKGDGAPAGEYHVTIKWPWDLSKPSTAMADRLGRRYVKPEQSQWTVTVSEGKNQLPPLELTNVAVNNDPQPPSGKNPPMPGNMQKTNLSQH